MADFLLSDMPLDIAALRAQVLDRRAGGYASFEGWVRDHHAGRAVDGLDYEAYAALAEREGERLRSPRRCGTARCRRERSDSAGPRSR